MALSITGFIHCNVNCSDLVRSRAFYEGILGLEPTTHTNPDPQDGAGFAMDGEIQWDAWILRSTDDTTPAPSLDLLEWKLPRPIGVPYPAPNHLGMVRLSYVTPELDGLQAALEASGAEVYRPPVILDGDEVQVLYAKDPDGTTLEFAQADTPALRPVAVNVNCTDLEHSTAWYCDLLGLDVVGHSEPGPTPGAAFGIDGDCEWEANFLFFPDDARAGFGIDLVEWQTPTPTGTPYTEPNHLGIFRMALGTTDIQGDYQQLQERGVRCFGPPAWLDLGPGVPSGGCWALFFSDPDGTCIELIETRQPA